MDFPTNLLSFVQEKGRACRHHLASPDTNVYFVVASFEGYCAWLKRILWPVTGNTFSREEYAVFDDIVTFQAFQQQQVAKLQEVLVSLLVLPTECQQVTLEKRLANPFTAAESPTTAIPCYNACQYCRDRGVHPGFPRISIAGVRDIMIALLLGPDQLVEPDVEGSLLSAMTDVPNANSLMFGSRSTKPPTKATLLRLLLMLFSAGLLIPKLVTKSCRQLPAIPLALPTNTY
jgi:hypothetical protein